MALFGYDSAELRAELKALPSSLTGLFSDIKRFLYGALRIQIEKTLVGRADEKTFISRLLKLMQR